MPKYEELYEFLISKVSQLTEEWYESIDKKNTAGVYTSSVPEEIRILKEQNKEFHLQFFPLFIKEDSLHLKHFEEWIVKIAKDESHLLTPSNLILKEFYRTRNQYLQLIKDFVSIHKGEYPQSVIDSWNHLIIDTMDKVTVWFLEEFDKYSISRLQCHQELINELSSPVIVITKNTGLLPLVGDIDTARAKLILKKTLEQCVEKRLDYLFIDLSGVIMVDTMVAQQIFYLHEALNLIGVEITLCGIRPEIAQTVIQLGLSFEKIPTYSSLERALKETLKD
ncbi:STAS domain-containing protein [Lederbergia wuyishanensis]|uniref:RsbT co-antagonist protein RsbR n=1 Tax=Lederbergia wuyishanensis TaxID=1347903 RepID=A0ABU0D695_9BACI|nr:STAS domain-containing protein [Lederbergia wuyishanensis]MCJ8008666.1 STAS domain-containing protein [Lederbergia wuyishanensis]MDQ0343915.1 rsbT co-antagonist protein RsbR [Lederbergia wuyishanensis]